MRINKFISQANVCSRREADRLVEEGKVLVDGKPAKLGDQVDESNKIVVRGQEVSLGDREIVYLAYHKPAGIICTTDKNSQDTIIDAIDYPDRVYPIGRLDVKSSGLIFLTNDGGVVNRILKKGSGIEKEYYVKVDRKVSESVFDSFREGIYIDKQKTLPAEIHRITPRTFSITIVEGKNRQIRKMCEAFHLNVLRLIRIRIGHILLDPLPLGEYKRLSQKDIQKLFEKKK